MSDAAVILAFSICLILVARVSSMDILRLMHNSSLPTSCDGNDCDSVQNRRGKLHCSPELFEGLI